MQVNQGQKRISECTRYKINKLMSHKLVFTLFLLAGLLLSSFDVSAFSINEMLADPNRPRLYLADASTSSVIVTDTNLDQIVESIFVGPEPRDMAIADSILYVAIAGGSTLARVNLNINSAMTPIQLDFAPTSVVAGRPGRLYVGGCIPGYPSTNKIAVVDTVTRQEINSFSGAIASSTSPEGNFLYGVDGCGYSAPQAVKWDISSDSVSVVRSELLFGGGCSWDSPLHIELDFLATRMYMLSGISGCSENDDGILPIFSTTNFAKVGEFSVDWSAHAIALTSRFNAAFVAHSEYVANALPRGRHPASTPDVHVFRTDQFTQSFVIPLRQRVARDGLIASSDQRKLYIVSGSAPNQGLSVICLVSSCDFVPEPETPKGAKFVPIMRILFEDVQPVPE